MNTKPGRPAVRFRWDQVLVLAIVVVVSDFAGVAWLTRDVHRPLSPQDAEHQLVGSTPDAAMLDEEMERAVRRAALQRGFNPSMLPELPDLWEQLCSANPSASQVDVTDRGAVVAAFDGYLHGLTRGGTGAGGRGGGAERTNSDPSRGGASSMAGVQLTPTIMRLDELQALRLSKLAELRGIEPVQVMPTDAMRRAALASDDPKSEASQLLLDAYRTALMALEESPSAD